MINVAAGIIEKEGKYLIAQRHRNDTHGFKWEFPGGTLRRDESGEEGIIRELKEELNLDVEVIRYFGCYTEPPLRIQYYLVRMLGGEIKLTEHEQIAWVEIDRLLEYDLLSGDRIFVDRLRSI
jgi:8-oxo-dGTP diphosphatase